MAAQRKLANAVYDIESRVQRLSYETEDETASRTLHDAAGCIAVVRRMLGGMELPQAFGSPGDWGYDTPIGEGLCELLNSPSPLSPQRPHVSSE